MISGEIGDNCGGNTSITKITLDAELRSRLNGLREPVELCDEDGQVVGTVYPSVDLSEYDLNEPPLDPEEVQRRLAARPRYSTQEVLDYLASL